MKKQQILTYHVNNTYAKLALDTLRNKKIKEIMRYTGGGGGTGHSLSVFLIGFKDTHREINLKPGLHLVVTIAGHVCDDTQKGILKLTTYLLQIFLVKGHYYDEETEPYFAAEKACLQTCACNT